MDQLTRPGHVAADHAGSNGTGRPVDELSTKMGRGYWRRTFRRGSPDLAARDLPSSLVGLILRLSGRHQVALSGLAVVVFALQTAPLEIQRRIVNDAFRGGDYSAILRLCGIYAAVACGMGLLKLTLNVYRSWVGERMVRVLRLVVLDVVESGAARPDAAGIETAITLAEADSVGTFAGSLLSEPLLQGGHLAAVFGYMIYLQPGMALAAAAVFVPQLVFVPLMQSAINRRVGARTLVLRAISSGLITRSAPRMEVLPDRPAVGAPVGRGDEADRVEQVFSLNIGIYGFKFSLNFLMNLLNHAGVAALLAVGGWFVVQGRTEIGTVVAFLSGLAQINDPWGDLVTWFRDLTVTRTRYHLIHAAVQAMLTGAGGGDEPARSSPDLS